MVLTPTYHVFDMYKAHQNAELVESFVETETIGLEDNAKVPSLHESVSVDADGMVHITLVNLSAKDGRAIESVFADAAPASVKGEIVGGEIHEYNSFENQNQVHVRKFDSARIDGNKIKFEIPAASVLHLEVELGK